MTQQKKDQVDPIADNFFMPVGNTKPYFKAAFQGFAGSGKTYTSAKVAIGLHKKTGSKKPVIIFDTEKASKFLKPMFAEAGIELLVRESKSLADLAETMKRAKEGASEILIIDSISHIWEDFLQQYAKRAGRTRLQFQDWGIIKPTWKDQFSDPFVQLPLHIIMCGRAGYEYDNEINQDTQRREIYKSGVKMKVEGETAYEPDMIVYMERFEDILGDKKEVYRQGTVIKDRANLIDGKTFKNPTYEHFNPSIEAMLEDPTTSQADPGLEAGSLFRTEEDKGEYVRKKKIALEEIEGWLVKAWPSTGASDKAAKLDAIESVFNTRSWMNVEEKGLDAIEQGLEKIKGLVMKELEKQFPDKASEVKEKTDTKRKAPAKAKPKK